MQPKTTDRVTKMELKKNCGHIAFCQTVTKF